MGLRPTKLDEDGRGRRIAYPTVRLWAVPRNRWFTGCLRRERERWQSRRADLMLAF
jgi:hypothetical protein